MSTIDSPAPRKNEVTNFQRILTALRLRCPRCLKGKLFRNVFRINSHCPECNLELNSEPGFFIGSLYPNYAVTVVFVTGLYWLLAFGFQIPQRTVLWICLTAFFVFPIWFLRYARSIWLAMLYEVRLGAKPTQSVEHRESARGQENNPGEH
ncbi:DUF983 domain-containing protein [Planctomicrobium sp. SH668]|uniref:DUF983 domain-containing protein n=1 Tax=Planctomicrobium sp. SH668 TaxID=3448126 RepID=UPI003F5BAA9A